ncbi:MAG: endonuclease/exonuclease/phosphatase family protein [Gemmatimonadales bacterium]
MKQLSRAGLIAGLALAAACSDTSGPATQPIAAPYAPSEHGVSGIGTISVYTQNLYVDAVIAAIGSGDQQLALEALSQAIATLHRTSFATRAAGIAEEIARARPDVVGFQEGSKIDVDLSPLGLPLIAHEDFLATLRSALDARGLSNYVLADSIANIQASLLGGMVSLIDYDIMLVNARRVTVGSTVKRHFANNNGVYGGIDFIRGFVEARITVQGREYVVVTTHTEGTDLTPLVDYHQLHVQQMQEIVDEVNKVDAPAIVMGDLNDYDTSPMYQVMTGAGFADVWRELRPHVEGNTCCHPADLSDLRPTAALFDERIDFVFARGLDHVNRDVNGMIIRYGLLPWERLQGPDGTIWPSDHAGLVAALLNPPGRGLIP